MISEAEIIAYQKFNASTANMLNPFYVGWVSIPTDDPSYNLYLSIYVTDSNEVVSSGGIQPGMHPYIAWGGGIFLGIQSVSVGSNLNKKRAGNLPALLHSNS